MVSVATTLVIATERSVAIRPVRSPASGLSCLVMNPSTVRTPTKKTGWRRLLSGPLGLVQVVFASTLLISQLSLGRPGHVDFYLHQSKYRDIVTEVKKLPLATGAKASTHLDGLLVNYARNASGSYTVTITTVDWNHAGIYGYVFSDESLTPHPNQNYPDYLSLDNPGDMPFSDKEVIGQGGHWWSVYNNLL